MEAKKYIHDAKGNKKSVILPIKKYEEYNSKVKGINKNLKRTKQELESIERLKESIKNSSNKKEQIVNSLIASLDKPYKEASNEFKKQYLTYNLSKNRNFQSKTARAVKIHRNTIVWFARKYGLPRKMDNILKKRAP